MRNKEVINNVVEKAIGKRVQEDMKMVSRTFYAMVDKYAFLFAEKNSNGDISDEMRLKAQKMLLNATIPSDRVMIEDMQGENEEIYFDMQVLLTMIPDHVKDDFYNRVFERFVSEVKIEDINETKE